MDFYNNRKYHGSLKYLSPSGYHQLFLEEGPVEERAVSL
ncbi:hypothetical protein [Peribacillus sp. SCS-155]